MAKIVIDPATRLEGHLKVEVESNQGQVTSARSSGMMYRGFENLLVGKDPRDAAHITQRICGVCPIAHGVVSAMALESAAGVIVTDNARTIRNLILGSDFLHSHILHFYHLAVPSFIKGPPMPPWTPSYDVDLRLSVSENQTFVEHYLQALTIRRQAHELGAVLGGKMPHTPAIEFGGVTTVPTTAMIAKAQNLMAGISNFIRTTYIPDVEMLASVYSDYFQIGRGYGNLLSFGVFDLSGDGESKLLGRGRVEKGGLSVQSVDPGQIIERAEYSWYDDSSGFNPRQGETRPNPDKNGGYSWLKAPRYLGEAYEVGPLARMWVNGDYRKGISVMDRHMARAEEARKLADAMTNWLGSLSTTSSAYTQTPIPIFGSGIGMIEAARGSLGHWLSLKDGKVASYQIVTPTCWNCSPRDNVDLPGPLEKALEGVEVTNNTKPIEVLRVVQSYDPCLSCAVH